MARLGELLVAGGLLTPEQLEQALRAQVMWGGRLGTNLIELGFLDLDALSQALGRLHQLPAALGRHFEKVDRELQRLLSADVAERFCVVPLVRVGPEKKVVIASVAPLAAKPLAIIADELAIERSQLIPSIAAELRIRYQLERIYGIPRTARFMRSPGKTVPPFPTFEVLPDSPPTDPQIQRIDLTLPTDTQELAVYHQAQATPVAVPPPVPVRPSAPVAPAAFEDALEIHAPGLSLDLEPEPEPAPAPHAADADDDGEIAVEIDTGDDEPAVPAEQFDPIVGDPGGDSIMPSIMPAAPAGPVGDLDDLSALASTYEDELAVPAEVEETPSGKERRKYVRTIADVPPTESERQKLGRIAIRKVAVGAPAQVGGMTLGEATRSIRRAQDRDRVAELVVDTLFRFAPSCEAALMLVIRGDVAISWKGFARSGATPPEMAVPMKQAGLVPRVVERNCTMRSPTSDLGPIDQLLMVSLGQQTGELVVVPVSIGGLVMCVIAMVTVKDAPAGTAESIAAAAGAAFARLMRDASR